MKKRGKKEHFRILNVPEDTWWEEARHQPRIDVPRDYAGNPCVHCHANCCRKTVFITTIEVLRMTFTLGIPPAWLVDTIVADPKDKLKEPWPLKIEGESRQLRLLHRDGVCAFSVPYGDGLTRRCGVWSVRPGPCRLYPFKLELGDRTYRVGDESFCPVHFLQNDALRETVKADAIQNREDVATDKEWAKKWNRGKRDRSWGAFLNWLFHEMAPAQGFDLKLFDPIEERPFFRK